jgi:4-hydroxyphenylpyruvate dioxygenase
MRLAISNSCFPGVETARFLELAAEAGAEACELRLFDGPDAPAEVVAAARAGGLRVESVGPLMDWALPDDEVPHATFETLLVAAVELAAPFVVCVAPITSDTVSLDRVLASASERYAELGATAARAGVRLAFEQVGRSSTRPGLRGAIQSLTDALAVAETLVLDSYNLATAGVELTDVAAVPAERIAVAQVSDTGADGRTLPGDGDLPLRAFVDAVRSTGYAGALTLELFPPEPVDAQRAVAALRELSG